MKMRPEHYAQLRDMLRDDCLYGYLNDTHIDTALKAIVKEVQS